MAGEGVGVGGTYVTRSSFDSTSDKHISSMKNNKQNIWKGNKFTPPLSLLITAPHPLTFELMRCSTKVSCRQTSRTCTIELMC